MPTFGHTTNPTTENVINANAIIGSVFTPATSGYAQSVSVYVMDVLSGKKLKCGIYRYSNLSLVGYTEEKAGPLAAGWQTFNVVGQVSIIAGEAYVLVLFPSVSISYGMTYGVSNEFNYAGSAYDGFPPTLTLSWGPAPRELSIYCTYTETVPVNYTLTISATVGGTTNPVSGGTYLEGTVVSVAATAIAGYMFDHWVLDGANAGDANPISVTMNANHTLQAVFTSVVIPSWSLTISASAGGSTNPTGMITGEQGTATPAIIATADPGYAFVYWLLDGSTRYTDNPISLLINDAAAHTLQATFEYQGTTVILGYDQAPATAMTIYANEIIGSTFQSPASGYLQSIIAYLADVAGSTRLKCLLYRASDLALIGETQERIGNMVIGWNTFQFLTSPAVTQGVSYILALYSAGGYCQYGMSYLGVNNEQHSSGTYPTAPNPLVVSTTTPPRTLSIYGTVQGMPVVYYSLSISSTIGGTTNPATGTYQEISDTMVTVTASASSGYTFDHWVLDGVNAGTTPSISITMNANHTLQAVFAPVLPTQFTLTINSTPIIGVPVTVEAI